MRVLDTAALLYWPAEKLVGGVCAVSQIDELSNLSESRAMLVNSIDIDWRSPSPSMLESAREVAADSGDLPRLSDVDLDLLALAIAYDDPLFTDDYRLQNALRKEGRSVEPVGQSGAKQVWKWQLKCKGCRRTSKVPSHVDRSKKGAVAECDVCGGEMFVKRAR